MVIENSVNHSVVSHSETKKILRSLELFNALRTRLFGKSIDPAADFGLFRSLKLRELACSGGFELDGIAHVESLQL